MWPHRRQPTRLPVPGILQARILEWISMPSSRGYSWPRVQTHCLLSLMHWQAHSLPLSHQGRPRCHAAAKSLQSCPTLCDPIDGSPPGSPVPGVLQARTLEWVAISFSNAWKWKVKMKLLSRVRLLMTPRTAAYQAPLSMGFSRQESLPFSERVTNHSKEVIYIEIDENSVQLQKKC